jgi:hypothetical protein
LLSDSSLAGNIGAAVGAIKNEALGVSRLFRSMVLGNEGEVSGIDNRGPGNVVLDTSLIANTCAGAITSAGNNVMEKGSECGYDATLGDGHALFPNWLF